MFQPFGVKPCKIKIRFANILTYETFYDFMPSFYYPKNRAEMMKVHQEGLVPNEGRQ